jgi:putative membrane protein
MSKLSVLTAVCVLAFAGSALAASDREFLTKAMQGDNSEVRLGGLAERMGASRETKAFGRMLAHDHGMHKTKLAALDRRLHVRATDAIAPEARDEERKLRGMRGRDFDREFANYMVMDHQKDIADYEAQARDGSPQTRRLAGQTLPTLHKHLDRAQRLADGR